MKSGKQDRIILYIDDEQANLDGFVFNFRKDFQIFVANNIRDAYNIINKHNVKVILSDNRMPDMLGTEFFEVLSVSHPDIIRILVTAYADTEAVMQAINKGRVYRFITKPWNRNELFVSLENAFEAYNLKQKNNELITSLIQKNSELEELTFKLKIEVVERTRAEEELADYRQNLEQIIKERTLALEYANRELVDANEEQNQINEKLEQTNIRLNHEIQIRTHVQEMLAESENKFRGLIEQSSEGIMLIDLNGKIIECNKAIETIVGYKTEDILNTSLWEFEYLITQKQDKTPDYLAKLRITIQKYINNIDVEQNKIYEGYRETSEGKIKFLSLTVFPVITQKGKFIGRIVRDYTMKMKQEEELRLYKEDLEKLVKDRTEKLEENEQRLSTLSDNLPGGAIYNGYTNKLGIDCLVYSSARIVQISGISYENLLENFSLFASKVHPDDLHILMNARKKSLETLDLLDVEIRYIRSSKVELWLQLRTVYKNGNDGNIWWDGYVIDITKRKLAEKAARESNTIIENIQEGIASKTGEKFFETIVLKLSETLKADYTFIGEIFGDNNDQMRTIALCSSGEIVENMSYSLEGSPCIDLIKNGVNVIPYGLSEKYPNCKTLGSLNSESYVGVTLQDSESNTIGIMVAQFKKSLDDIVFSEQILKIFSSRVGAEMERIKTDADLKEREERFRTLFELSPNYKIINKLDGTILDANPAFIKMSGYRKSQILGNSLVKLEICKEPDFKQLSTSFNKHHRIRNVEMNFKNKDGIIHFVLISIEPVIINGLEAMLTIATDVTERKLADEAIQQYSDIAYNMQVALNVFSLEDINDDNSLVLVKVNPAAEKIIGKTSSNILCKKLIEILPELAGYEVESLLANVVRTGIPYENEEFRFFAKNGKTYFFSVKAFKVPNNCVGLLFEDITRRKTSEKLIKENEERYRALFDKSPSGIHLVGTQGDDAGKLISVNPMVLEMLGYTFDELLHMPIDNIMRDLTHEEKLSYTNKLMSGATLNFETNFYTKNDIPFPVEVTESTISLGDKLFILGIDRDISERKRSEQLVKESEQKLLNIFHSSSDGIIITDFNLNIIEINDTLIKMLGYENVDISGVNPFQLILPEYFNTIKESIEQLITGNKLPGMDVEVYHKNGTIIPVEVNSKVILHDGKPCLLNILRDTTERRTMEKMLFETIINTEEKERERFAGDLHDEVGPLLSSLKLYISLLSETEDKKKKEYIIPQIQTLIKESITTVREISNDLSPHVLNNYGCVAAINSFISLKRDFLDISFNQNLENRRYQSSVEIVLYRIVKELINNTIKHAKASAIDIKLFEDDNNIKLQYSDNGKGFDINTTLGNTKGSIGLLNIMSRIKSVNGKYKINSMQGSGFNFELIISI